ncbi:MAG: radical SAM protein [Deltaproteobacteria bacterium]|nr:radical SAM protein [Deltaproteobacteria bacterium]
MAHSRPKRYALAIELTSYCNQKCGYCYNDFREDGGKSLGSLPTEELLALVDRALTEVEFDHVTLTGGEPFARADIFDVMDVAKRHGVGIQIISNGGLITEAMATRLAPYKPSFVQVTLDGATKEQHEAHVGEGHYDKTLRGISLLKMQGVTVVGCTVISRKNAKELGAILDQFRRLGVTSVALSRFSPAGYATRNVAELLPSRSDMIEALSQAEVRGRDHKMQVQVTMPMPPCVIEHSDFPNVRFGGCPIGTEMQEFALGPKGELRNCTLHTEVIGDGHTQSFAELVEAPAVMHYRDVTPEFCAPCPHKRTCVGGCGAAGVAVMGKSNPLDPFVAQHVDDGFRAALKEARRGEAALVPANRLRRASV